MSHMKDKSKKLSPLPITPEMLKQQKVEQTFTLLERNLKDQLKLQARLSELLQQRLTAIKHADHKAVNNLCDAENKLIQELAELEKTRLTQVAELTQLVNPASEEPMVMSELAEAAGGTWRNRILGLRAELKARMESVRKDLLVAKDATERLAGHMNSLAQRLAATITKTGVYQKPGMKPKTVRQHGAAAGQISLSTFSVTG